MILSRGRYPTELVNGMEEATETPNNPCCHDRRRENAHRCCGARLFSGQGQRIRIEKAGSGPSPARYKAKRITLSQLTGLARRGLIKETFTTGGTAQTGNSVVAIPLSFEFVVISEFFVCSIISS